MFNIIKLNAIDNVAVAPMNIALGSIITSELKAETNRQIKSYIYMYKTKQYRRSPRHPSRTLAFR